MKVTAPADFSHVTPLDRGVAKGEQVDVDDELGAQLVAQGWKAGEKGGPVGKSKKANVGDDGPESVAPPAQDEEQ